MNLGEGGEASPMDTETTMVVFDPNAVNNKRETRPVPPPNSEKASPDPKKIRVTNPTKDFSVLSAMTDVDQSCREQA
jgi:hypothetical protein